MAHGKLGLVNPDSAVDDAHGSIAASFRVSQTGVMPHPRAEPIAAARAECRWQPGAQFGRQPVEVRIGSSLRRLASGWLRPGFRSSDVVLRVVHRIEDQQEAASRPAFDGRRAVQQAGFRCSGHSVPRSRIGAPGRHREDPPGRRPIGRDAVLRAGPAIGADEPRRDRVDMELAAGVGRYHVEAQAQPGRPISAAKRPASSRDIVDEPVALGAIGGAGPVADLQQPRRAPPPGAGSPAPRQLAGSSPSIQDWTPGSGWRRQIAAAHPGRWSADSPSGVSATPTPTRRRRRRTVGRVARSLRDPAREGIGQVGPGLGRRNPVSSISAAFSVRRSPRGRARRR
jgi:hypothetical protein